MRSLLNIEARNFRSLQNVRVALSNLNVLVGPNGAGKSNFIDLIRFLGDSARDDLKAALDERGGYGRLRFRGEKVSGPVAIEVAALVTSASNERSPDNYKLTFWEQKLPNRSTGVLRRNEEFLFRRTQGRFRRIAVTGQQAKFTDTDENADTHQRRPGASLGLRTESLALSTLRRLPRQEGGEEIEQLAELFTTAMCFDVDVTQAIRPSHYGPPTLKSDASNLAHAIIALGLDDWDRFDDFLVDARAMIPGLKDIQVVETGVAGPKIELRLAEKGLGDTTYLQDASFGTVRVLALLAMLYDPNPPYITCIEEIDNGLHPYLLDRLVDRLREASQRTQFIIATHSPALVSRLRPEELIVVERGEDGSSRLPAITTEQVRDKYDAAGGRLNLGEMWFSGGLGGVPR